MRIELPILWIVVLNLAGWPVIQFGLAWAFTRMPVTWFNPGAARGWERGGRFYEGVIGIKRWKDWLPDAARWFGGGFAKSTLVGTHADYLRRSSVKPGAGNFVTGAPLAVLRCSSSGIPGGPTWSWSSTRWRQICRVSSPSVTTGCASNDCLLAAREFHASQLLAGRGNRDKLVVVSSESSFCS